MASSQTLTAGTSTGDQASTQSPQTAGQPNTPVNLTSQVQPGTSTNLLNGSGGVPLQPVSLSTVSLDSTNASTKTAAPVAIHHSTNPILFGASALLFILAISFYYFIARSSKNTTI